MDEIEMTMAAWLALFGGPQCISTIERIPPVSIVYKSACRARIVEIVPVIDRAPPAIEPPAPVKPQASQEIVGLRIEAAGMAKTA